MVVALRALASPAAIATLLLLLVNDHVLKQAWPGVVTGKLSDFAGLVVAPLILAAVLAVAGLVRPVEWACALTALGFSAVKVDDGVAALVSSWWSLTGIPTTMRADPTDLIALPAVLCALAVHRRVARHDSQEWRRTASTAIGLGLLPIAVLATAATSCDGPDGVTRVWLVSGNLTGPPPGDEQGLVVDGDGGLWLLGTDGDIADLTQVDASRLPAAPAGSPGAGCDASGHCWRVVARNLPKIEMSTDAGTTWTVDHRMTEPEAESALAGVDASCGEEPSASAYGLVVLPEEFSDQVVVAVGHAGLLRRSRTGAWSQVPIGDLPGPGPSPTAPGQTPAGSLTPVLPVMPPDSPEPASGTPDPPCPSPSRRTVTPDPANGGPTTYEVCP